MLDELGFEHTTKVACFELFHTLHTMLNKVTPVKASEKGLLRNNVNLTLSHIEMLSDASTVDDF